MNYYLLEPCNWGESAEDCRVVVAGSEREARALLNITHRNERDWFAPTGRYSHEHELKFFQL